MSGPRLLGLHLRRLALERPSALALVLFVLVTAFVFGLAPRLLAATADDVLGRTVAAQPVAERSLEFDEQTRIEPGGADDPFGPVDREGDDLARRVPGVLAGAVVDRIASADTTRWSVVSSTGAGTIVTLRFEPRALDRVRLVAGRAPQDVDTTVVVPGTGTDPEVRAQVYEVALVEASAAKMGVGVGDEVLLRPDRRDPTAASRPIAAAIRVVGLYAVPDPTDAFWYGEPALLRPTVRAISNDVQFTDVFALAAPAAYATYLDATADVGQPFGPGSGVPLRYHWRLAVDPARLASADVPALSAGLRRLESSLPSSGYGQGAPVVSTRLLEILTGEDAAWRSALALLVVMATGPVAIAAAAFGLVALLSAERRRISAILWRARGASRGQLLAGGLVEAALLVVPAALAGGALAAVLVPVADSTSAWIAVAGVAVATGVLVLATVAPVALDPVGSAAPTASRARAPRPAAAVAARRRVVVETVVVLGAVLAAWLLRERGVHGAGAAGSVGIDPLVAIAPALAGAAAGLVAIRLVPLPIAILSRIAAGGRGLVTVLGLRRATRGGASTAVLLVLLVTAIVGTFSSAALVQLDRSASAVAWHDVGAPFRISANGGVVGPAIDPATRGVAPVPAPLAAAGATAVSAAYRTLATASSGGVQVRLLALDPDGYRSLVAGLPIDAALPAELSAPLGSVPANGPGPVLPALVSTALGESRAGAGPGSSFVLSVDGRQTTLRTVAVRDAYPTLDPGTPWVVVSRAQLEAVRRLSVGTTDLFVRAPDAAADGLARVVDDASAGAAFAGRAATEASLRTSPIVDAVTLGITAAAVVAAVYAALAVVAALALAAASRAGETGILRTFGLTRRDALGLVVAEHGPTVGLAFGVGVAAGLALFLALRPGLGLGGVVGSPLDVPLAVEPVHLVVLLAFVTLVAIVGIAVGAAIERRAMLATVVRRGVE